MRLLKWHIFLAGLTIIFSIFFIPRLYWLKKSIQTKATVLYIEQTRLTRPPQNFPVFRYYANDYRITCAGSYNLPFKAGDTVLIRYNPQDVFDLKVDDFKGHWIGRIMWLSPVLFVWILMFIPKDFNFSISIIKGKLSINFG